MGTQAIDGGEAYNLDDSMISWCSQLFRDIRTVWYHICCTQIAEQAFTMGDVISCSDVVHPEHSGHPTYTDRVMQGIGIQKHIVFMCGAAGASNYTYRGRKTGWK